MKEMINIFKSNIQTTIWKYYAFAFLSSTVFFSAVLVPFYTEWGHISLAQAQILQSWFMLWVFILEIPTGVIADKFSRKTSVSLGALVFAVSMVVYGVIPNFTLFLIGEFLAALGISLISGAGEALLYDSLKEEGREEESKKIFGRAESFDLSGIFIGAILGGFIASKFGLNAPMYLTAIPFFLSAVIAWSIKEPKIRNKQSESKRYLDIARNGLQFFMAHKTLRLLVLDSIVVSSAAYFVIWLYQPLLQSMNFPISYFGWVHASLVAVQILIASNFMRLEKIFGGVKNLLGFSAVITGLNFALVGIFPSFITAILFIVLAGGFGLTRGKLMEAYMNKHIESHQRATVLSSISMFRRLALVVLNPVVGFTADRSLPLALVLVGLLPLLVFLFSPLEHHMFEKGAEEVETS